MKLIHKLIIGFLLIALLIWLTGFFALSVSKRALQHHFINNAKTLAIDLLGRIDREVQGKIEILQEYTLDELLKETVMQSNQHMDELENKRSYIISKDREWTSLPKEETSPFMNDILKNKLSWKLREKKKFFENRYGYRVFGEIFVTNKYGANVAQTGKTSDYRQDDEEWCSLQRETACI